MKRFVVGVRNGFFITGDGDVIYQYEDHSFDTYSEARRFAMQYPKEDTYLIDTERLPF